MNSEQIEAQVDSLLKETVELIPVLFAHDPAMQLLLKEKVPAIKAYTKKVWVGLDARSIVDYITLTANMGNAFVTANPKFVLECRTRSVFMNRMTSWVEETLGIKFDEWELSGKAALEAIAQRLGKSANDQLRKLNHDGQTHQ